MLKYELIPAQLLHEGSIQAKHLMQPTECNLNSLLLAHDPVYLHDLQALRISPSHARRIGFPISAELVLREKIITQGTIDCALHALQYGMALNVAGGTHHAFANRGEGFCLLNDMAVAAHYLLHSQLVKKILIVDVDVHQGNGTAKIFENEKRVFTFSMHGASNFPFIKEKSDLDIALKEGIEDVDYLMLLESNLNHLIATVKPDFIFYLCGVDILESDKFGKLKITMDGCKQRDRMVLQACKKHNIACAAAMGGGYSPNIKTIVEAHCNTFRIAMDLFEN